MLTLKKYRAMKEKSLRVFRRWEVLKAGRGMLWRKRSERQRYLLLQCGVIPAVGSPSTSLQMLFRKAQDELLQKPSGSKGTWRDGQLVWGLETYGIGGDGKHPYEHGFAPREGRGETPKTAVPWVISVHAADASVQSWRCKGLGLAVVQSRVGQPWCTAPLTAAAPRAAELQPHWGRGQRPPGWDLHAKGSRQGRLPYPSWPRHLLFPVSTTLNQLELCPEVAEQMDDVPLLQGWFEGNHWVICHHCCLQDFYLSPGSEKKLRRCLLHPQSHQ